MRRTVLLCVWLLSDAILFIAAYALAYGLRVGWILSTNFPLDLYLHTVALAAIVWLCVLLALGVFRLMRLQGTMRNITYIVFACIVGSATFTLAYYFLHDRFFSRLLLVEAFALNVVFTAVWHVLYERIMRTFLRAGRPVCPTLIIGATRESSSIIKMLLDGKNPLTPVAVLDSRGMKEKEIHGVPVMGKLNKLEGTIKEQGITHLIQCSDLEHTINLLSACRAHGITYMLLPSVLGIVERDERIESLEGRPVTVVRPKEAAWHWFFS